MALFITWATFSATIISKGDSANLKNKAPFVLLSSISNFWKNFAPPMGKCSDISNFATKTLHLRQKIFQSFIYEYPDATVITNTERKITNINPAFKELFGFEQNELTGSLTEVFYANKKDYKQQGAIGSNSQAQIHNEAYEVNYKKKDGTEFTYFIDKSRI